MNRFERVAAPASNLAPLLRPFVRAISGDDVLNFGCGAMDFARRLRSAQDQNVPVGLEMARGNDPAWIQDEKPLSEIASNSHDYVIALDPSADDEAFRNALRACRKGLIFSGGAPAAGAGAPSPGKMGELRNHHVKELIKIGSMNDRDVFAALKQPGLPLSPADATLSDIAQGCDQAEDWRLLLELVRLGREQLGFFPNTITRTVEYPWFAQRLEPHGPARVLDLGAGVCPLPLWFAQNGFDVVTIDHSPLRRDASNKADWNNWGYLDYSRLDKRIASHHVDAQFYQTQIPFDAVYSVSVIEHMPAEVRRKILSLIPQWLAPRGKILFSLDLVPESDELWPLCEGQQVDPPGRHGSLKGIIAEIETAGFNILDTAVRRRISGSRTDLAFIEARK